MQISTPSSNLKCPTCRVHFENQDQHKQHYKSDFHRYNLKRSMVNLPPATLQQFSTKRSEIKNTPENTYQCGQCKKTFASAQTLNQHAQSKKHNIHMIRQAQPQKLIDQQPKVFTKNSKRCLFCLKESETFELSLTHMARDHSFFIPQQNYCVDKAKLILYLQQKIEVGMMCIFCENKGAKDFATGEAVRMHMLSKNHTFMKTENGYQEYEQFYDFSSLFNQKLEEQRFYTTPLGINFQKVKVIVDGLKEVKKNLKEKAKIQNGVSAEEDSENEEWDDVESQGEEGEQEWESESDYEQTGMIAEENEEETEEMKQTKKRKIKTYQIMVPTLTATDQLLLPNGKMLGHRKYKHIYKQAVKLNNWFENNKLKMIDSGMNQQALALRSNLIELIKKDKALKTLNRREDKKWVKSGIQNSNLFRHFRSSNPL